MIELKDIILGPEEKPAIKVSNFVINEGDIIGVLGPSDSGKTSLLRAIVMADPTMKGEVYLNGELVNKKKRNRIDARKKIGYLSQSLDLFSNFTLIENVMRPQIDLNDKTPQEAYDDSLKLLKRVGLSKRLFAYPDELSTSEKQRAAIARAICMDVELLVFDEPTNLLDRTSKKEVEAIISEIVKNGVTLIFITNELSFARKICNRIVYVDDNSIYEEGPAKEILDNPKRIKTKSFIKSLSLLEVQINDPDFDFYGINTRIENFIVSKSASRKVAIAISFSFEELANDILVPELSKNEKFRLNIIYSYEEEKNRFVVTFKYDGKRFSPEDAADELALMILKHNSSEFIYEEISEDGYTNKVIMVIDN